MRLVGMLLLVSIVVGAVWFGAQNRVDPTRDDLVHPGPDDPDAPTDYTTTASGLKYRILRQSDGPKPGPTDTVHAHYRGTFAGGAVFDSTYARGQAAQISLKSVIKGWIEGMQLIGEGGKIELIVPPELAYGPAGRPPIPPDTTLYFLIELIEIVRKGAEPKPEVVVEGPGPVDADAPTEFSETPSGLKYRILRKSDGVRPGRFDVAEVQIQASRGDKLAYSSYGTRLPLRRGLTSFAPGMAEGLQLIGKGGMIELLIPNHLRVQNETVELEFAGEGDLRQILELIDVRSVFSTRVTFEDLPPTFETTESGLKYRIIRHTAGRRPELDDEITVNYIGWLHNGSEFDGSYLRGRPSTFRLDQGVIKGWREGLQYVGVGGMIELEVPSNLGYGLLGNPPRIPPDETLHFAIELLEVN